MGRRGIIQGKRDNLVKDLKETTVSFKKLGRKYGVSRQGIHVFCTRQGIKRPSRPKGHQAKGCHFCKKLIEISKRPHSEFISIHTIAKETGGSTGKCSYHLRTLRDMGLVSQRFGRLLSRRLEKAYVIYFTKRPPVRTIERELGINNFRWLIRRHRALGWNVPPSLYVYAGPETSGILSERHRRKKR